MLINFFNTLKKARVPVSIKELLDLLAAMEQNLAFGSVDDFYLLRVPAWSKMRGITIGLIEHLVLILRILKTLMALLKPCSGRLVTQRV